MSATAQSNLDSSAEAKNAEQAERDRIKRERAAATEWLEQQRKACYQKLAVTPCLNEARDQHNEKTRDLKRQEVALNDAQRKRAAAEQVRKIEQRNSPQAQQELAERRGKAMQANAKREQERAERERRRQAKLAEQRKNAELADTPAALLTERHDAQLQAKPREPIAPKTSSEERAAQAEKRREQMLKREKDALENQQRLQQREAQRKKPAAASLPIPN